MSTTITETAAGAETPKTGALSFGTFYRGLRRHPLLVFLVVMLTAGAAAGIWFFLPLPKMTGYTLFRISSEPQALLNPVGDGRENFVFYKQAQSALVKSRLVLNKALETPEVRSAPLLRGFDDPIGGLESKLLVDFKAGQEFMRVAIEGDNESELEAIVKAVTEAYRKHVVEKDSEKRSQRRTQLEQHATRYDTDLTSARKRMDLLSSGLGSSDPAVIAAKERLKMDRLALAEKDLLQVESELRKAQIEAKAEDVKLKDADRKPVSEEILTIAIKQEPGYQKILAKRTALTEAIEDIKRNIAPGVRPATLVQREEQLAACEKELQEFAAKVRPELEARLRDRFLADGKRNLAAAKDRVGVLSELQGKLQGDVDNLQSNLKKTNTEQLQLEEIKRSIAQTEKMYERVTQELETLKAEQNSPPRVSIWDGPVVVPGIEGNRRLKYTALAGVGVLIVGLGLITLLEVRNRRIVSTDEVATDLGLKVLGTVPTIPRSSRSAGAAGGQVADWQHALTECVDTTRTLLVHSFDSSKPCRTIMVASALPDEGKTMLGCHLATSLARAGYRTLLIDGDLRRPSVHRVLGTELTPGLCEVLRGEATLVEAARASVLPGLTVLAAGVWNPAVSQALSGDRWRTLKGAFESAYDYVVVDSSPLLLVTDGLLMARQVDGVVISVLWNVSQVSSVGQARDRLASLGVPVLGVVINGLDLPGYRSAYDYYRPNSDLQAAPKAGGANEARGV